MSLVENIAYQVFFRHYTGFYLANVSEFDQNYLSNHKGYYPQRTDLQTTNAFMRWSYAFNGDKYSQRAALRQSEKQKKSSGSFLLGVTIAYLGMQADSSIVADSLDRYFPSVRDVKGYRLMIPGITAGYGFTLKLGKNLFLGARLLLGINREFGKYQTNTGNRLESNRKIGSFSEAYAGVGYNGQRIFMEISTHGYSLNNPFDQSNYFITNFTSVRLHFGYRFEYKSNRFFRRLGL